MFTCVTKVMHITKYLHVTLTYDEWDEYGSIVFSVVRLSCQQIRRFVDGHNRVRLAVAQGKMPNQPTGKNLKLMVSSLLDLNLHLPLHLSCQYYRFYKIAIK